MSSPLTDLYPPNATARKKAAIWLLLLWRVPFFLLYHVAIVVAAMCVLMSTFDQREASVFWQKSGRL